MEKLVELEHNMNRINQLSLTILDMNIKFWHLLKQQLIVLDDLMEINADILQTNSICMLLWMKQIEYLKQKKKWQFYYAWYQLHILNKKIRNSLIESFSGYVISET